MARGKHLSLEEARKEGMLDRFAKEHPAEGDEALFAAKESAISDHVIEWSGQPVTTITRAFNRARDLAKLGKDVTPHVLRHTAASWALNKNVPLKKISKFLGHKDMRTTELIYAKARAGFTDEAARAVELKVVR